MVNNIIRFEVFPIDFVAEKLVVDKIIRCYIGFHRDVIYSVKNKVIPFQLVCDTQKTEFIESLRKLINK